MAKIKFLVLAFALSLICPSFASAQAGLQNGSNLQNQTNNAQNTGGVGPSASPQTSKTNTLDGQSKLSVVASPDQKSASVSVGQSTSKTEFSARSEPTKIGFGLYVSIAIFLGIMFWISYRFASTDKKYGLPPAPGTEPENTETKPKNTTVAKKSKSKKKKRAHR